MELFVTGPGVVSPAPRRPYPSLIVQPIALAKDEDRYFEGGKSRSCDWAIV